MSEFDTNYSSICCPYCEERITRSKKYEHWIDDLEDEDEDFFLCQKCKKLLKQS